MNLFDVNSTTKQNVKPKVKILTNEQKIQVIDEDLKKKIAKANFSPTVIEKLLESPGDWVMEKYIEPAITIRDASVLERGKWYHSIMENFYKKPAELRNYQELKKSVQTVTATKDYEHLLKDGQAKDWLRRAIKNYSDYWLKDASKEKVAEIYDRGSVRPAIEFFVRGTLGDSKRNIVGFVDKMIEGENGLIVQDWKTGGKVYSYNPDKPVSSSNPFGYYIQQIIYSMLLESNNKVIESACLLFPCTEVPTVVNIDIASPKYREMTINAVNEADRIINECIENDFTFNCNKGIFNGWSSYLFGLGNARFPTINEAELDKMIIKE